MGGDAHCPKGPLGVVNFFGVRVGEIGSTETPGCADNDDRRPSGVVVDAG